jgi:hypothetical protein
MACLQFLGLPSSYVNVRSFDDYRSGSKEVGNAARALNRASSMVMKATSSAIRQILPVYFGMFGFQEV